MQLDTEEQRKLLLDILESINVPGKLIDHIYDLKKSILNANIQDMHKPKP